MPGKTLQALTEGPSDDGTLILALLLVGELVLGGCVWHLWHRQQAQRQELRLIESTFTQRWYRPREEVPHP